MTQIPPALINAPVEAHSAYKLLIEDLNLPEEIAMKVATGYKDKLTDEQIGLYIDTLIADPFAATVNNLVQRAVESTQKSGWTFPEILAATAQAQTIYIPAVFSHKDGEHLKEAVVHSWEQKIRNELLPWLKSQIDVCAPATRNYLQKDFDFLQFRYQREGNDYSYTSVAQEEKREAAFALLKFVQKHQKSEQVFLESKDSFVAASAGALSIEPVQSALRKMRDGRLEYAIKELAVLNYLNDPSISVLKKEYDQICHQYQSFQKNKILGAFLDKKEENKSIYPIALRFLNFVYEIKRCIDDANK